MSSQTRSSVGVDEETGESLRDTIDSLMGEEMEKLRDELWKCSMVTRIEFPRFRGDDVRGWLFKSEHYFKLNNIPDESKVRSRGSDFDIPVVFSLVIALLRNKFENQATICFLAMKIIICLRGVWMHPRFVLYSMDYDIMIFGYLVTDDWVQSTSFTTDFGAHDSMVTLI
ncbi:hypothetical protein Tco_0531314 [Tanacetum coccineum]